MLGSATTDLPADEVYGHLRVAGMDVALPLSALREALPCPRELDGLPALAPGLLGAMNHRSAVLPVVDLGPVVGRRPERTVGDVVVVVAFEQRLVGLLTEEVVGIVRVARSALRLIEADGGGLVFSASFTHPETGTVVSVLDAGALTSLPGIPTVTAPAKGSAAAGAAVRDEQVGPARATRHLMLVRCGGQALAIDVAHVHTTTPECAPRPSVLTSELCRGVVDFRDVEVPVVDPLVLFGLGAMPQGRIEAGLVLSSSHGYVILAVNALLDLTVVPADEVLPMSGFSLHRPELVDGILAGGGAGQCVVIDGAALLVAPEVVALGSVNTAVAHASADAGVLAGAGGSGAGASRAGTAGAHLIFTAGVDVTTSLDQVVEILPHPAVLTETTVGGPVQGVLVHRGHAVPILGLTALLGKAVGPLTASSCVLVVDVDGEHVGFAVDSLSQVSKLVWSDPDTPEGDRDADLARLLPSASLVQAEGDDRLLPRLDLRAIARAVRDGAPTRALAMA